MTQLVVSVCITTFNQDRYIKDCVVSVLAQMPDTELEILIGDDGIGPETPHIIARLMERYPKTIRYFKHEKNLGPSANYQFLIREARGRFIAHLDGDDLWLPGKLAAQLVWFDANPQSVACYTNAVVISDSGELKGVFCSTIREPVDLSFLLRKGNFLNHSSMLYRASHKNLIVELKGSFIDYRMHLGFAMRSRLGFINAALVVYRLGSEHSMVRRTPTLVQDLYFEALSAALSDPLVSDTLRKQALRYFWRAIVVEALAKGRISWAMGWAKKVRSMYPRDFLSILIPGIFFAVGTLALLVLRRLVGRSFGSGLLQVLHER